MEQYVRLVVLEHLSHEFYVHVLDIHVLGHLVSNRYS